MHLAYMYTGVTMVILETNYARFEYCTKDYRNKSSGSMQQPQGRAYRSISWMGMPTVSKYPPGPSHNYPEHSARSTAAHNQPTGGKKTAVGEYRRIGNKKQAPLRLRRQESAAHDTTKSTARAQFFHELDRPDPQFTI